MLTRTGITDWLGSDGQDRRPGPERGHPTSQRTQNKLEIG